MIRLAPMLALQIFAFTCTSASAETTLCTEIASVPHVITQSGVYCLKQNLTSTTDPTPAYLAGAIEIEADDVTLDLNGFTLANKLAGPKNRMNGIVAFHRRNVIVRNGHIDGFANGVLLGGLLAQRSTVEGIRANASNYRGLFVVGDNSIVRDNRITNTGPGELDSASQGITLVYASNSVVDGNIVGTVAETASATGIGVGFAVAVSVRNNTVFDIRDAAEKNAISFFSVTKADVNGNRLVNPNPGNAGIADGGFSNQIGCRGNSISAFVPPLSGCDTSQGNFIF